MGRRTAGSGSSSQPSHTHCLDAGFKWLGKLYSYHLAHPPRARHRRALRHAHHLQREVAGHARELGVGPVQDVAGDVERVLVAQRVLPGGADG
jgi:hypothetical protein